MSHQPFPDVTPASPEQRAAFHNRQRGALPFKFIPADEGGWYVSPAWSDDPAGRQLFGQVFLIRDDELPAFLLDSYSYYQTRIENDIARGEKIRAAREALGGRRPTSPSPINIDLGDLSNLDLKIDL